MGDQTCVRVHYLWIRAVDIGALAFTSGWIKDFRWSTIDVWALAFAGGGFLPFRRSAVRADAFAGCKVFDFWRIAGDGANLLTLALHWMKVVSWRACLWVAGINSLSMF
jgi:hypothetical protein